MLRFILIIGELVGEVKRGKLSGGAPQIRTDSQSYLKPIFQGRQSHSKVCHMFSVDLSKEMQIVPCQQIEFILSLGFLGRNFLGK